MADIATFMKSLSNDEKVAPMLEKEILYINDSNGGSYNGNITFDTTVLSNSGKWLDYSEGTIQIPIVCSMIGSVNITAAVNAYMMGLKNGHYHIIDSIQVDYNNKNVVQLQSFTNFYVNYKVMSTWSEDTLKKYGAVCGVWPDTSDSCQWATAANARGNGISNNSPYPLATKTYGAAVSLAQTNEGLKTRIENTAVGPLSFGALPTLNTAALSNQVGKNYFTDNGVAAAGRIYYWYIIATIRLKDIADFFDKLPLVKGAQLRFTVNYNSCRQTITNVAAGPTMTTTSPTMLSGRTVPFMICDSTANAPTGAVVAAGDGTLQFEFNIRQTSIPASPIHPSLSSCRIYVPAYTLNPELEIKYLEMFPTKNILYDDIYGFVVSGVGVNSAFNSILTNGIVNPQHLIIVPMISGTAGQHATVALQEYQSPFDSAPGTTAPQAAITSFNVLVSGKTIFQQDQRYDFDAFLNEVSRTGVDGGIDIITSGLIGYKEFTNSHRYYVVDISRRFRSEDVVPKSVQIQGTNNTDRVIDYYCFITYRRSLSIELSSGAVIS